LKSSGRNEVEIVSKVEAPKLKKQTLSHKKEEKSSSNQLGFSVPAKVEPRETRKTRASTSREVTKQPSKSKNPVV